MTTVYYNADELEAAYEQASQHEMPQVWRNALERAYDLLLASDAIAVEFGPMGDITHAHIPSQSEPGKTHYVNGTCDCTAAQNGKPCAHRAAKRLLNIAHEQTAARTVPQGKTWNDDLCKPEDETHEARAQRIARKRSSAPINPHTGRARKDAYTEINELFA